jgi:hypothetical protein
MARRCVQGVCVDVKIYVRRMRIGFALQRAENTKVRKNHMRSQERT